MVEIVHNCQKIKLVSVTIYFFIETLYLIAFFSFENANVSSCSTPTWVHWIDRNVVINIQLLTVLQIQL